jgi:hypothetical protein
VIVHHISTLSSPSRSSLANQSLPSCECKSQLPLKWAEPFLTDAHVCSIREAGFQTGKMQEGKGGAWRDFTFGIATQWTGVKA